MEKSTLIFGGIVVLAVVIIYSMRQKAKSAALRLNSPGSPGYYGGRMPVTSAATDQALGGLIASVGSGLGGLFHGSGFGGQSYGSNNGGINDPGLDVSEGIDYPGDNNSTLATNNSYDSEYDPTMGYDFSYA